jgi:hypothetical protein
MSKVFNRSAFRLNGIEIDNPFNEALVFRSTLKNILFTGSQKRIQTCNAIHEVFFGQIRLFVQIEGTFVHL